MSEVEISSGPEAPKDYAPRKEYDLVAEERQRRRHFFIAGPLALLAAVILATFVVPLAPPAHAYTALLATIGFVATFIPSVVDAWDRLTIRVVLRILAVSLLAALFMAAWALVTRQLGILTPRMR